MEKIIDTDIVGEMQKSFLDYAMSVIVARALPDVRDGLKPVHRRILFGMKELGLNHTAKYSKCAKIVGDVMGKYHPHGDIALYDTLVRMAQDFSLRYPLIDGQGNFGNLDGDPPAAYRYTEARLSAISQEMLQDIEKETVEMTRNFDNTLDEPVYLPAKLPNLLLMGCEGIAVGMATKIPPHNLTEVVEALIFMIDRKEGEETSVNDLMQFIKGPDFPTGGAIYDQVAVATAYATGRGPIIMRAIAEIEDIGQGKSAIIINELPYQTNKGELVAKIAELIKDHKIEGISGLTDESDRKKAVRVVIELKRDAAPRKVLNNLYKMTEMQKSFPVNMVALVQGTPQTLTLKVILEEYLKHRIEIIRRRSEFELKEAMARAHILEGLKIALDNIDEVIRTIKESESQDAAKINLMRKFGLSDLQATAILDMQLRRLAHLERQKIEDELLMIKEAIAYLEDLLSHKEKIMGVIREELLKLKEKYGDARKTKVFKSKVGEFSEEDLIVDEPTVVALTKTGYVKRLSPLSFRTQQRGGKGVVGMTTKDEDEISHLLSCSTHDNVLFFTNFGKVYQLRVWEIQEASRQSKGQAIVNILNIQQGEKVESILTYEGKKK